jgi:hypothetical protein
LLGGTLRTAFASVLSAAALFAFYYLTNENLKTLLSGSVETIFHNQKLSDFIGGAMFLAICGVVFAAIYLVLINLFGAIEPEDKQKLINLIQKYRFGKNNKTAVSVRI